MKRQALFALLCAGLCGCSFYMRSADDYRKAVRGVLEEKRPEIEACYKSAYESDAEVKGRVVVQFDVEAKTGKIMNPTVVEAGSNAPDVLQTCVVNSLSGLVLTPPDQKKGEATFTWDFAR